MDDSSNAKSKSKGKGRARTERPWTREEDEKLMEALRQLHVSGKYDAHNGFKPEYNQVVETLLDVSLPNSGLKAEPHIRSRLKTLRINFSTFHDMVVGTGTSGFGWNSQKCVLTVTEDVWEGYVKTHSKASVFKDKPFPLYHKFSTIFGKDRASGARAINPGDEEDVGETQETTTNDLEYQDIDMVVGPSPRGVDSKSKKRKRGKTDDLLHMYSESSTTLNNTITLIGNEMNMNLTKTANDNQRRVQSEIDLMRRVKNEIESLPDHI